MHAWVGLVCGLLLLCEIASSDVFVQDSLRCNSPGSFVLSLRGGSSRKLVKDGSKEADLLSSKLWKLVDSGDDDRALSRLSTLVRKGAQINARHASSENDVVLHRAARHGMKQTIQELCDFGAEVNIPNEFGYTPLHVAANSGHLEAAQALLRAGADLGAKQFSNWTPEDVARNRGFSSIAEMMARWPSRPEDGNSEATNHTEVEHDGAMPDATDGRAAGAQEDERSRAMKSAEESAANATSVEDDFPLPLPKDFEKYLFNSSDDDNVRSEASPSGDSRTIWKEETPQLSESAPVEEWDFQAPLTDISTDLSADVGWRPPRPHAAQPFAFDNTSSGSSVGFSELELSDEDPRANSSSWGIDSDGNDIKNAIVPRTREPNPPLPRTKFTSMRDEEQARAQDFLWSLVDAEDELGERQGDGDHRLEEMLLRRFDNERDGDFEGGSGWGQTKKRFNFDRSSASSSASAESASSPPSPFDAGSESSFSQEDVDR